ncbi:MAG: hypothetical protein ABIX28_17905 [Vicinamibacterales bacterium]
MKRQETTHAVTFEIAETKIGTASTFQPRLRLDAIVFVDLGPPRRSPLDALEVLAAAFAPARRSPAERHRGSARGGKMDLPALIRTGDLSDEAA